MAQMSVGDFRPHNQSKVQSHLQSAHDRATAALEGWSGPGTWQFREHASCASTRRLGNTSVRPYQAEDGEYFCNFKQSVSVAPRTKTRELSPSDSTAFVRIGGVWSCGMRFLQHAEFVCFQVAEQHVLKLLTLVFSIMLRT